MAKTANLFKNLPKPPPKPRHLVVASTNPGVPATPFPEDAPLAPTPEETPVETPVEVPQEVPEVNPLIGPDTQPPPNPELPEEPHPEHPIVLPPEEPPPYVEPVPPDPIPEIPNSVPPSEEMPPETPETPLPPEYVEPVTPPHVPMFPEISPPISPIDPENPVINPLDPEEAQPASPHQVEVFNPEPHAEDDDAPVTMTQLDMLKNRARLMGIDFSNNIGVAALGAKIKAKLDGEEDVPSAEETLQAPSGKSAGLTRQEIVNDAMKLVRLRITNLDPKKKDLPGEIFCVANEMLGAVKKFIPYGESTDNGYHVPNIIYQQLKEREFLNIKTRKDNRGRTIIETGMSREFALEVLPQLTQKELDRLAASQAASAGMSD